MKLHPLAPLRPLDQDSRIRVAIVDDDTTFARFVAASLEARGKIDMVCLRDGDELLAYPHLGDMRCIILDFQLETESGLQVVDRLRSEFNKLPPIIMLTGTGDERRVIKAFRSGCADYLPKRHLDFAHLEARIFEAVQRAEAREREEQEFQRRVEKQAQLSVIDELTGCYTREYILDRVKTLFSQGQDRRFALLLIDFETMDAIGSSCGLAAAQSVRKMFARRLQESVRSADIVGRFDEHRFICIADTDCAVSSVRTLCDSIAERLSCEINLDGRVVRLVGRVGGVLLPSDTVTEDNFISVLEERLVHARETFAQYALATSKGTIEQAPMEPSIEQPAAEPVAVVSQDRRKYRRRRVLRAAKIYAHDSSITLDCSVRNISDGGALLRFDTYFRPPNAFSLRITGGGEARNAEVRWQNGNDVGVEFVDG